MLKILFIGDIVGQSGRNVVIDNISSLTKQHQIDLVIANAENSAHGKGITEKIYHQLLECGIDVLTMGNHTFAKNNVNKFINRADRLVRPINMNPINTGLNYKIINIKGLDICIFNVLGNVFMHNTNDSCFDVTNKLLKKVKADLYLCDFHGEATSEKITYAYYYQDIINIIVGTHTHVQTADERLLGGTAFITDVGMSGPYDSILGRSKEEAIARMVHHDKTNYSIAEGPAILSAVIITVDTNTKKAISIERIQHIEK
ncbi:MAG: TIGR00282 family metallophosphoesterase [Erysipelotrichaceae bacterium]